MKKIILLSIFCVFTVSMFAQQNTYSWRIGAYSGYNFYRGDLNSDLNIFEGSHPLNNLPNTDWQKLLSYGGSLEYSSQGFGIKLLGTRGIFRANDRAANRNGDFISHANFDRSLNAETQLYDVSILATFYSDNGRILSQKAFASPYFSIGFGGTHFDVFSNLSDANNQPYYYWSNGLIYNKPEDSQPTDAIELTQDDTYETNATDLENERVNYNTLAWNIPMAVGLKFRISDRLNMNLEVMGRYVNSDYLDDVSQRGHSDDKDIYGFTSLSLHYNFGQKSEGFVPPIFYSLGTENEDYTKSEINTKAEKVDTLKIEENLLAVNLKPKSEFVETEKIISNPNIKTIETEIDTSKKILILTMKTVPAATNPRRNSNENSTISLSSKPNIEVVKTPTLLLNDKTFNAEKQIYLEVQKTRLEVAELNEQANILLKDYDASKVDSFAILNQKIEALSQQLQNYQQYIISLAIQGNANHTKPENQAIRKQTSALERETEALRQKYRVLVLGEDDPKVIATEVEKLEAKNEANKAKIKALEADVQQLENIKTETELPGELEFSTAEKPKSITTKSTLSTRNTENLNIISISKIDTSTTFIKNSVTDNNPPIPTLSDSMTIITNDYEAKLKTLTQEVERLNRLVIPQKNQTINRLKTKVDYLEGELKGIKETNRYWADFFQKEIKTLQIEITKLNLNQPIQKSKVIEKIVRIPTESTTKTVQQIITDFGISNIYFDNGQTTIESEFNNRLNRVVTLMNEHSGVVVTLKGYTDKSGNLELNFKLSKKRSEAVKSYLISKGISASRIDISYFGEYQAVAMNDPFSRRVEVILMVN